MTNNWWLSLLEVGACIQSRQLSSVSVTEMMLERINKYDPSLNSFALVTSELARAQAKQSDAEISLGNIRGPLHGVPIAVKDLCDTQGIITAGGTTIYRERMPQKDATVVSRLRDAGAVLLGKTQMTEGAFTTHHPSITVPLNPWNRTHWSGVSSSGSGVATAAGLCFGSIGSDTLGSIRFPSTVNGLTGLKPTWGRVSRAGVLDLAPSMDHIGPMARSAADCAAMLAVIAGPDALDPSASERSVPDYVGELEHGIKALKIGVDLELIAAFCEDSVVNVVNHAVDALKSMGCKVDEISMPPMMDVTRDALSLAVAEAAITHKDTFATQRDAYGPVLAGLIESGQAVDTQMLKAIRSRREQFARQFATLFDRFDLILFPGMNAAAPTIEDLVNQQGDMDARLARTLFTAPINMSRSPSLTLPGGVTDAGMPIGFQLVAACFDELSPLKAGNAYQRCTAWHLQHPPGLEA